MYNTEIPQLSRLAWSGTSEICNLFEAAFPPSVLAWDLSPRGQGDLYCLHWSTSSLQSHYSVMAACWEMLFSNQHPSSLPLIITFVYLEELVFFMDVIERKFYSQDGEESVILFSLINQIELCIEEQKIYRMLFCGETSANISSSLWVFQEAPYKCRDCF